MMKKYDGISVVVVTEHGETFVELLKKNPKFNHSTAHKELATVKIAQINLKQATAIGTLLIRAGK